MDEEIGNLNQFGYFEKVPWSEALKHGRLVKSKWAFKGAPGGQGFHAGSRVGFLRDLLTGFLIHVVENYFCDSSRQRFAVGLEELIHSAAAGR